MKKVKKRVQNKRRVINPLRAVLMTLGILAVVGGGAYGGYCAYAHYDKQNKEIKQLNTELDTKAKLLAESESNLKNKQSELASAKAEVESLTQDKNALQAKLTESETKVDTLSKEKAELQKQLKTTEDDLRITVEARDNLQAQVDTLTTDKENLQNEINSLNANIATLQNEKATLQEQLQTEQGNSEELQTRLNAVNASLTEITTERNNLQNKLNAKDNEINSLNEQIEAKDATIEQLTKDKAELQEKINNYTTQITTLQNENEALNGKIDTLNDAITEKSNQIDELNETITNLHNELEALKQAVDGYTISSVQDSLFLSFANADNTKSYSLTSGEQRTGSDLKQMIDLSVESYEISNQVNLLKDGNVFSAYVNANKYVATSDAAQPTSITINKIDLSTLEDEVNYKVNITLRTSEIYEGTNIVKTAIFDMDIIPLASISQFKINNEGYITAYAGNAKDLIIPGTCSRKEAECNGIVFEASRELFDSLRNVTFNGTLYSNIETYDNFVALRNGVEECTIPFGEQTAIEKLTFKRVPEQELFAEIEEGITMNGLSFYGGNELYEFINNNFTSLNELDFSKNATKIVSYYDGDDFTIKGIGVSVFEGNTELKSLIIEEGIETVETLAFNGCTNLTKVILPSSVTSIEGYAFMCPNLTSREIDKNNKVYNDGNCNVIIETKTKFGFACFRPMKSEEYTISKNIEEIGVCAFIGCGLKKLTVQATTPPTLKTDALGSSDLIIYVPAESVETYKTADGWQDLADRIQAIEE